LYFPICPTEGTICPIDGTTLLLMVRGATRSVTVVVVFPISILSPKVGRCACCLTVAGVQICLDIPDAVRQLSSSGGAVDLVFVDFSDAPAAAPLLTAAAAREERRAVAVIGVISAGDCAAVAAAAVVGPRGLVGTVPKPLDRAQASTFKLEFC
jgi:hypothetical protein